MSRIFGTMESTLCFRIVGFSLKSRMDFWGKLSGLVDFENTVDRGSAVIFDTDSGLCSLS